MQDDLAESHTIIYHNKKCQRCDARADVYHGAELLCTPCYFEKKQKSDARTAAKLARLSGAEAPAAKAPEPEEVKAEEPVEVQEEIAVEEEPVIKKAPKKSSAKKQTEQTEEE